MCYRIGGVQAMTACFEHQSLPLPVAHAIIALVCNLKLWLNFRSIMQLFIPLRSKVLRYMCNLADKDLRTQGIKTLAGELYIHYAFYPKLFLEVFIVIYCYSLC